MIKIINEGYYEDHKTKIDKSDPLFDKIYYFLNSRIPHIGDNLLVKSAYLDNDDGTVGVSYRYSLDIPVLFDPEWEYRDQWVADLHLGDRTKKVQIDDVAKYLERGWEIVYNKEYDDEYEFITVQNDRFETFEIEELGTNERYIVVHYSESSPGFVMNQKKYYLKSLERKFDKVYGDSSSKYVVLLRRSNIAHKYYSELIYSDNLDSCIQRAENWLNQRYESEPMMEDHLYANIVDIYSNEEIGYGDSWSDGSKGWKEFSIDNKI